MNSFVATETPAGTILVEIDEAHSDGIELLGIRDQLPSFEDACEAVKKNAIHFLETLQEIGPDEVEITCGIKVVLNLKRLEQKVEIVSGGLQKPAEKQTTRSRLSGRLIKQTKYP